MLDNHSNVGMLDYHDSAEILECYDKIVAYHDSAGMLDNHDSA